MSSAIREALERAHAFRASAQLFSPLADPTLAASLRVWAARSHGALAQAIARCAAALAEASPEDLACEQERLLGGRGGSVPCRETSYADPRRIAPVDLAELSGFLEAFGLDAHAAPPDHVCVECELASVLGLKQAYALSEGWAERAEIARSAYERLFATHLALWLPRFAARLRGAAVHPAHLASADLLEAWLLHEAARLGVALGAAGVDAPCSGDEALVCGTGLPCSDGSCAEPSQRPA